MSAPTAHIILTHSTDTLWELMLLLCIMKSTSLACVGTIQSMMGSETATDSKDRYNTVLSGNN